MLYYFIQNIPYFINLFVSLLKIQMQIFHEKLKLKIRNVVLVVSKIKAK